jgi:hypothetical protein
LKENDWREKIFKGEQKRMKIWKCFFVLVLSVILIAIMAACEGGLRGGTTPSGVQVERGTTTMLATDSIVSAATTTATPTGERETGGVQKVGGCTTAASCQKAIVKVTPNQVKPGGTVTVVGKGWVANARLQASIGVQALDSNVVYATSDARGNFSVTLTIDPQTPDFGPTNIHVNLVNTTDGSKNLTIKNQLTIVE